jgi:hypothetical protein
VDGAGRRQRRQVGRAVDAVSREHSRADRPGAIDGDQDGPDQGSPGTGREPPDQVGEPQGPQPNGEERRRLEVAEAAQGQLADVVADQAVLGPDGQEQRTRGQGQLADDGQGGQQGQLPGGPPDGWLGPIELQMHLPLLWSVAPILAPRRWRDIRRPADVAAGRAGHPEGMDIRISLDRTEPPAGRLRQISHPEEGDQPEVPFTGWLGLLRALYQVVEPPEQRPPGAA